MLLHTQSRSLGWGVLLATLPHAPTCRWPNNKHKTSLDWWCVAWCASVRGKYWVVVEPLL